MSRLTPCRARTYQRRFAVAVALSCAAAFACRSLSSPESEGGDPPTHPEGIVSATLPLTGRPHGVAVAPSGAFCVSRIDASSVACGTVTATSVAIGPVITVGAAPAHVALNPAGTVAYTADQLGNTSTIVDVRGAGVTASVQLGDNGFNVAASRTHAYVSTASGRLVVIDGDTRTAVAQLPVGPAANGLALDTLGNTLYVSSRDAGTVVAINTGSNAVTRIYPVGLGAQRVALSPDGKTLYVASETSGVVVLDVASGATGTISGVPAGVVGLALSPDGARLYATNPPQGMVQIIDAPGRQVVTTLTGLGRPRNVAFGAKGATALVTDETGSLIIIR